MGKVTPEAYLTWEEPKEYRRAVVNKKLSPRRRLIYALVLAFLFFAMCVAKILEQGDKAPPLWTAFLGFVVVFLGFYTSVQMDFQSKTVAIKENGVQTGAKGRGVLLKYKEICEYRIESELINEEVFDVLCIKLVKRRRSRELRFGIPSEVCVEELDKILSERLGKQQDPEVILRSKKLET